MTRICVETVAAGLVAAGVLSACPAGSDPQGAATKPTPAIPAPPTAPTPVAADVYSAFGPYVPPPAWSGWCGLQADDATCAAPLIDAVRVQTKESRPTVRGHGWPLWAATWAPIAADGATNDARARRTNLGGTGGCWSQLADGSPACSGFYPLWLTWPNTGAPYKETSTMTPPTATSEAAVAIAAAAASAPVGETLRAKRRAHGAAPPAGAADPSKVQTVDTAAPTYALPPLALSKHCKMTTDEARALLAAKDYAKIAALCPSGVFCPPKPGGEPALCDGTAFVNQGDVMIATESLSREGYADIQANALYDEATLQRLYVGGAGSIGAKIGPRFVSTKHMFWPVKGCRPGSEVGEAGCRVRYGALPPWVPRDFRKVDYATNADYLGYETWKTVVAIDTCAPTGDAACPPGGAATLALAYVTGAGPIVAERPAVYRADDFMHVQVSQEVLTQRFTPTDRALLDQATIWAYGDESGGFEAGDFLVVAAMHVNTKELDSWALQSVWWSPMTDALADCPLAEFDHCYGQTGGYAATAAGSSEPNATSGLTRERIAAIDAEVGATWREHYLMVDSYGIRYQLDGTAVTAADYFAGTPPAWAPPRLTPVAMNVYIEPVIHPLGTDCQNCHRRAGYPDASCGASDYPGGCGRTSYQVAQCAALLGDYGPPGSDPCMTTPWAWRTADGNHCKEEGGTLCAGSEARPVVDTDLIWLIADNHVQKR